MTVLEVEVQQGKNSSLNESTSKQHNATFTYSLQKIIKYHTVPFINSGKNGIIGGSKEPIMIMIMRNIMFYQN